MNNITKMTRKEAFKKIKCSAKQKLVYEQLEGKEYTASELSTKMYNTFDNNGNRLLETPARQEIAPRLTELEKLELVEVIGKKTDEKSGCKVAIYRRKENKNV